MSDLHKAPWLHITSQFAEHGEAILTGTRDGLIALRDAVDKALETGDGKAAVYSTDGEGYAAIVRLSSTKAGLGEPVYFETIARNAYHTEIRLHEHIIKDRRRRTLATPCDPTADDRG